MTARKQAGSPAGEPFYLAIGFLRRPHGVQGEMIMDLHTDFPERIRSGRKVYIGEQHTPITLESVRHHGAQLLIKLRGHDTPESAGRYRNQWMYVKTAENPPLPEGGHYQYEMIGLDVVAEDGRSLGSLSEILVTGANDVYVVRNDAGKEILLPAISSVILSLDMHERKMRVHLLDGLIDNEEE